MPKIVYAPPGVDPTETEYPVTGLTPRGCLQALAMIGAAACLIIGGGAAVIPTLARPSSTATPPASSTPTPEVVIQVVTATPTATYTPSPTGTIPPPPPFASSTKAPTATPTMTNTPAPTMTPRFDGDFHLMIRYAGNISGRTMSGVDTVTLKDYGAACPDRFALGVEIMASTGRVYLCADRAATATCKDKICTIIVYGKGDPALVTGKIK
jgi:hypothetical protein